MTNEQLAIVINGYRRELEAAIDALKDVLPTETGTNMLGQEYRYCPDLAGLCDIVKNMGDEARMLGCNPKG